MDKGRSTVISEPVSSVLRPRLTRFVTRLDLAFLSSARHLAFPTIFLWVVWCAGIGHRKAALRPSASIIYSPKPVSWVFSILGLDGQSAHLPGLSHLVCTFPGLGSSKLDMVRHILVLLVLATLSCFFLPAAASLYPTKPISTTIYQAGLPAQVLWIEDGDYPHLNRTGEVRIDLYEGNSVRVFCAI